MQVFSLVLHPESCISPLAASHQPSLPTGLVEIEIARSDILVAERLKPTFASHHYIHSAGFAATSTLTATLPLSLFLSHSLTLTLSFFSFFFLLFLRWFVPSTRIPMLQAQRPICGAAETVVMPFLDVMFEHASI